MFSLFKKLRRLIQLSAMLGLLLTTHFVYAMSDQALFKHAKNAYDAKNEIALAEDVSQLKAQQYMLAPYADYWLMLLKMEQARDEEIQNFLAQYAEMAFADRLRAEWLKKLAKQKNWGPFFQEHANFKREDVAVKCYALLGHLEIGDADVNAQAHELWLTSADLPSSCNALFDKMQALGTLTDEDIWARFRVALQDNKLILAKAIASRLSNVEEMNFKLIDLAYQGPQALLESKPVLVKKGRKKVTVTNAAAFNTRYGAEVNLYALDRLARNNVDNAVAVFGRLKKEFSEENQAFAWGRIAYHAARGHHPNALEFYALAKDTALDKEQLAWKARAALRATDWPTVKNTISAMSKAQAEEGAWRYWKARALKEQNLQVEANAIFALLANERHYYGWLAAEELESMLGNTPQEYTPTDTEVMAIASQAAIKRALEFNNLEMRWEAKLEWAWAMREFDDKQLLAAAELAQRQKWYDTAISTADNTKSLHNYSLRYPTPYRDLFRASARNENIDEAWIYGLVRQESRFMHFAKSGVGAAGLMQLMPATAKWAAKRMGLDGYRHDQIHDLSTNVEIGTYYMRYTLELMSGQAVMATAAYNAGPGRAKKWMASTPLEAAIYIESIPFLETRLYVQKVMANAQMYAPKLGLPVQSLKARLGVIPSKVVAEPIISDSE
ncbi:MAG: lytic transglycosylase domain-containing protein [Methylotenera sp.]|nr:lytic transglycosylase domain-containing protein [Methylotenera sp.]